MCIQSTLTKHHIDMLLYKGVHLLCVYTEYIDEAFDGKKLWPTDPFERAQGRLIVDEYGNKVSRFIFVVYTAVFDNFLLTSL